MMSGLREEQLVALCDEKNARKGYFPWVYWTSELYSFGKYIRKYGYYPAFLPLAVYSDHSGPTLDEEPFKHELECDAPIFLTHSQIKSANYINITGKKSYVMFSPAVFCRRINKIEKSIHAKGTIAFPVHGLPDWEEIFDTEKYIQQLMSLPDKFQPVSVCMHMHDVRKGRHKMFLENNIPVFTAGNSSDQRFIERLYAIIKEFKYSTSNYIGTITFLSMEMGIPFFIYGEGQIEINKSDINLPLGPQTEIKNNVVDFLNSKLRYEVFEERFDPEVKRVIDSKLGINTGISRGKMAIVLWKSLFLWLFSVRSILFFKSQLIKLK